MRRSIFLALQGSHHKQLENADAHRHQDDHEMRRQSGLKLRAQNGCNLVYAMWRSEPESKLGVSVTRNPGLNASSERGNSVPLPFVLDLRRMQQRLHHNAILLRFCPQGA
jgi:hypothetical protein